MFSLSLHELTACVYYKLAIERGLRGSHPDSEKLAHAPRVSSANSRKYASASGGSPRVSGVKSSGGSAYNPSSNSNTSTNNTNTKTGANNASNTNASHTTAPPAEGEDYECKDAHNMDVQLAIRYLVAHCLLCL